MKTVLNIKVDNHIKREAQKLAKSMGVPLSTIVNAQLTRFVSERKVELEVPLIPNTKTRKVLDTLLKDIEKGEQKNFIGPFKDVKRARQTLQK